MYSKEYKILLEEKLIGVTKLEMADAPMGVVFGLVQFENIDSPFNFIKEYCETNTIMMNEVDSKFGFIDTQVIPNLKVYRNDGVEIKGVAGNAISGMKEGGYEITVYGIEYPFFEEEFSHHMKAYKE